MRIVLQESGFRVISSLGGSASAVNPQLTVGKGGGGIRRLMMVGDFTCVCFFLYFPPLCGHSFVRQL